ncbi:MAG: hypothetical protein H8D23_28720, partial [Candidatus Brocadiales bacterium]|nr:hypothetical protein [Candidatus Brocadiales bacterium]
MLAKDIDSLVIGKNYLSQILSLQLLDKGKSIVLVDDSRLQLGELLTNFISQAELYYLETLGVHMDIAPLKVMDRYVTVTPMQFVIDDKMIRLGCTPSRNLCEIVRKLSFLFNHAGFGVGISSHESVGSKLINNIMSNDSVKEEFDKAVNLYSEVVASNLYLNREIDDLHDLYLSNCPVAVMTLFNSFKYAYKNASLLSESDKWTFRTFLYACSGIYQQNLDFSLSEFELFHIFLSLLSPHYELDHTSLQADLDKVCVLRGGHVKKAQINELISDHGKTWAVELSTFDGIIKPQSTFLFSGKLTHVPFKLLPEKKFYICLNVNMHVQTNLFEDFAGEKVIFSSSLSVGTKWPLWVARVHKNYINCKVFVLYEKGTRPSFLEKEVTNKLTTDLCNVYPISKELIRFGPIHESFDILFCDDFEPNLTTNTKRISKEKIEVYDSKLGRRSSKLKHTHYCGPHER